MAATADRRSAAVLAVLFSVSAAAYVRLPAEVPNAAFIAFLLPIAASGIVVMMRLLGARDHIRQHDAGATEAEDAILFHVVLFLAALQGVVLTGLAGRDFVTRTGSLVPRLTPLLLGVALIGVGNLLPRVRPNIAIGLRTARTLRDRGAWLRANRKAGYVAVALGLAVTGVALFVPPGPGIGGVVGTMAVLAAAFLVAWTWKDVRRTQAVQPPSGGR